MRRGRCRKQICMEAPPSSEPGRRDKRGWGEPGSVLGLRRQQSWEISTMAWALLLLTLLTQGSGEASREGTFGLILQSPLQGHPAQHRTEH